MDDEKPHAEDEHGQEEPYEIQEDEEPGQRGQRLNADFLLDKVIPDEIDWRDLVRRHPMLSVGVAAALGFLIGRSKGAAIIAGASAAVSAGVMRQLSDVLDGEVFEF
jgi:hypothetical protein